MAPAAAALIAPSSSSAFSHRSTRQTLDICNPLLICKKANGHDRLLNSAVLTSHPSLKLVRVYSELEQSANTAQPDPELASAPAPSLPQQKQSVLEALDFSAVRSEEDAQLLEDARSATSAGEKMSREQYAALRRKVGGTYRDFFKDHIEVDGEFVDEGWVDKSCRFCKKETASEPRTVDKFGRYAHVACLEKSKSGNFFTRLFGM